MGTRRPARTTVPSVRHLDPCRDPAATAPARRRGRVLSAVLLICSVLGALLLLDVLTARPASAHASLVTTTPADGARLETAPTEVTLQFSEAVSLGAGYARVLDGGGERVDAGDADVRDGVVTVPLPADLPEAGYVVTYRVISADSHPISGAYSFAVGDAELLETGSVGAGDSIDPLIAVLLPLARWLGYAGIALALGVPLALATCWPGGWGVARLRRAALAGLGAVVVGAVLSLLAQGPYAAASGLGSLLDAQLIGTTVDSGFGRTLLIRVVLAVLLAVVLARGWRPDRAPSTGALVAGGVLAVGLAVSVAAVGHPVAGALPGLAVATSTVHLAAMAGWLGGLVALFAGLLRPGTPAGELDGALARWSRLAGGYVAALAVTGVLQSVREVGSFTALVSTSYGWVLVAKLAVVLLVLVAALVSRDWVLQRAGAAGRPGRRVVAQAFSAAADEDAADAPGAGQPPAQLGVLRRSVLVELAGAVVVLALSAVLVSQYPAKASISAPMEATLPLQSASGSAGNGSVEVSLDPAEAGPTTLMVFLYDADGQLTQPQDISVGLTETQQQIGPLDVDLAPSGPGHYIGEPVLPAAGTWTLTVTVRLDEFTALTASTVFPVR